MIDLFAGVLVFPRALYDALRETFFGEDHD
jgi:hypothetical protein